MKSIECTVEYITPDIAKKYLELNRANRSISQKLLSKYAREMGNGLWLNNGQSIIFDWDGKFVDGQHRLNAIIKSNVAATFVVVRNIDPQCFPTIDSGKKRSSGDVLSIMSCKNANGVAAGIKLIIGYDTKVLELKGYYNNISSQHIKAYYESNLFIAEQYVTVKKYIDNVKTKTVTSSVALAAYHLMSRRSEEKANLFFELLTDEPKGIFKTLADKIINDKINNKKCPAFVYLALIIKVWNDWLNDREPKYYRYHPSKNIFPVMHSIRTKESIDGVLSFIGKSEYPVKYVVLKDIIETIYYSIEDDDDEAFKVIDPIVSSLTDTPNQIISKNDLSVLVYCNDRCVNE